jgi:AAA15 family ATPase/GTPase
MFVEFTVGNFRSFREPVTLSMLASKRKSRNRNVDEGAVFTVRKGLSLLKCATIFGANASGKSNIISAIRFLHDFVISSSKETQIDEEINVSPFKLSTEYSNKPSFFSISFVVGDELFQYSIEVTNQRITSESLKSYSFETSRNSQLFKRVDGLIDVGDKFPEGKGLEKKTRENALFLSVCANFDGAISKAILKWFRSIRVVSGLADDSMLRYTSKLLRSSEDKPQVMNFLSGFDLGFDDLLVEELPIKFEGNPSELAPVFNELKKLGDAKGATHLSLSSIHPLFDNEGLASGKVQFSFSADESEGTKKIVAFAGPALDALRKSHVLFIDEFDARLHPHLGRQFIRIFNGRETNSKNAQLIAITHDTNLLNSNILRRDQIWFTEKTLSQASKLTSLIEYKIRNNAVFQKEYDAGRFGAIPFLGDAQIDYCSNAFSAENSEEMGEIK